jgi:uncharacterized phage protein gp47/JayE
MAVSSGLAPQVTATGIHAGTYSDWLVYLKSQYQVIFGADVYLGNDSQDVQLMSVFALALADSCAAAIAVYNAFSPATAQGAGLSSVVKINGLARLTPSASTATVTVTGTVNTVITAGSVLDATNVPWTLPATVTIPLAGTIDVVATCSVLGAVQAAPASLTRLQSPVLGVATVTNAAAAAEGAPVETDAALRLRQSLSVALPSQTIFAGIVAGLQALTGVTRVRGLENNTAFTDANGIAAHSLAFIVEGGVVADIQNAIFEKITPGIPTVGAISATLTDANGSTRLINYATPVDATISVALTIKGLSGWSPATEGLIAAAVVSFISALPIGGNVSYTGLIVPAYLVGTPYAGTFNITAMTIQKNVFGPVSADIQLLYNEAAVAALANVTFTVS